MAKNAWGDEIVGSDSVTRNEWGDVIDVAPRPRAEAPQQSFRPDEGMTPTEKIVVGAGHGLKRAYQGLRGLPQALVPGLSAETRARFGGLSPDEADEEALYQRHHPGGWATAGDIGANVLTGIAPVGMASNIARGATALPRALGLAHGARAVPLTADIAANAATSAAFEPENRGQAMAYGGGGAAVGRMLPAAMARAVRPTTPGPQANRLIDSGVEPTFGQVMAEKPGLLPRIASRSEEGLMSVPIVGGKILGARAKAIEQFQEATRRGALPEGMVMPKDAADSVDKLSDALSQAYESTLSSAPFKEGAAPFEALGNLDDLIRQRIHNDGLHITDVQAASAKALIESMLEPLERMGHGNHTPRMAQRVESKLKEAAFRYKSAADPAHKEFGALLRSVAGEWADKWRTALPEPVRQSVDQLDDAYAKFVPLRRAAATGNLTDPNAYTPRVLLQAIRAGDKTPSKSRFVKGDLPQQQLATAANQVLGNKIPDTGTSERLITGGVLGTGGALVAGAWPTVGAIAAGYGYGTRPAQKYLTGQLDLQKWLAENWSRLPPEAQQQILSALSQAGRATSTEHAP